MSPFFVALNYLVIDDSQKQTVQYLFRVEHINYFKLA